MEDELDFSFGIQNLARFRGNVLQAARLRLDGHPTDSVRDQDLRGARAARRDRARWPRGRAVWSWSRARPGSGRSTTLAAMIDKINRERKGHIITVEDPIEFIHRHQGCIVNQREVGSDTKSFQAVAQVRAAPRSRRHPRRRNARPGNDPGGAHDRRDGSPRVRHAAHQLAPPRRSTASSTSSRRTSSPRCARSSPSCSRESSRRRCCPRRKGRGRAMAAEILVVTPAIRALIRDDKIHQIYSIDAGREEVRHADDERRAVPALHEPRSRAGRVPPRVAAIRTSSCA